ncbi:MAG: HD domain-containing phosphohydrolase [Pseudomonadota bacterium]
MRTEQVQVEVENLIKGMYVCQLDRPWLSTPFPFQGFVVRGERDIAALRKYCQFVYVDVLRGVPPKAGSALNRPWRQATEVEDTSAELLNIPTPNRRLGKDQDLYGISSVPIKVRPDFYRSPRRFRREMKRAQQFHLDLSREVAGVVDDIRVGRALSVRGVRRTTQEMVQSVIRHPDAFVWMIKLRDRDAYSYGHSVRMAVLSAVLGRHLGLSEHQLDRLALGALLCEVGKAKVPRRLLDKKGTLADEEIARLRAHVTDGVEILDRCVGIGDDVIEVVENHHERFDGSGYPEGKFGDQIPLLGRIAGLTDTYDAMTSLRPHTDKVYTAAEATDFLYDHREVLFQGQLVEEFIQALGIYPTGTLVELCTGEVALIKEQNVSQRIQPVVLMVLGSDKRPLDKLERVDLRNYNSTHEDKPVSINRGLASGEFGLDPNVIMEAYEAQRPTWRKLAFG